MRASNIRKMYAHFTYPKGKENYYKGPRGSPSLFCLKTKHH